MFKVKQNSTKNVGKVKKHCFLMYYDSDQYNDFLMYLETCVVAIGLPIQYKDFLILL